MSDALKQIWEKVDQMIGPQRMETEAEHIARDMREGRFPKRSDPIQVPVEGPTAIARHIAPGDDLVERLLACADGLRSHYKPGAVELIPSYTMEEAAARISALTATVAESRISEPHDPGDFVGDIYFGHPVKTTMGTHRWTGTEWVALPSEAETLDGLLADARAETARLRDRLARMEEALAKIGMLAPVEKPPEPFDENGWQVADTGERHAQMVLAKDMWLVADFARAALTDGGSNG